MTRGRATLVAAGLTVLAYVVIAGLVSGIDIPADAPTASAPWIRPFRVVATLGLAIAGMVHLPHVVGQLLAAIVLGGILGAVFATVKLVLR